MHLPGLGPGTGEAVNLLRLQLQEVPLPDQTPPLLSYFFLVAKSSFPTWRLLPQFLTWKEVWAGTEAATFGAQAPL